LSTQDHARSLAAMDEFLTVPEVAATLRVAVGRAYRMAAAGAFPAIRLSEGRIRVPRAAFEKWLAEQSDRALANVREPATTR
jgi:excisionase family DNA binding protein